MNDAVNNVIRPRIRDTIVRIVQVTDTHLRAEPGGTLLGMDTDHSLLAVLDTVRSEQPAFDLILGTGDLSDHGARGAYLRLHDFLSRHTDQHYWLPGNHDDRAGMREVAGDGHLPTELRAGNWQVLLLDSQVPGEVGGNLGADELARLRDGLDRARAEGLYTLVCLHHQPVAIGCNWLDEQMVDDAAALFQVLDDYPGVRGVLWGHVHQEYESMRGNMKLLCSPSTCIQFKPGQKNFALDDQPPGYRWLELHPDGELRTGVSRVSGVTFMVDLDSAGYL